MQPKKPLKYQRRATLIQQVFHIGGDIEIINWPSWAVKTGQLRFIRAEETRHNHRRDGWFVEGSAVSAYSGDTVGRPLQTGDYLVLESDKLYAYTAKEFDKLFELETANLLQLFQAQNVQLDEETMLPEDDLLSHYRRDNERTLCCLLLTGEGSRATLEIVASWTHGQCVDAENWALHEHLHASDNADVTRLPRPTHIDALPKEASDAASDL